MNNATPKIQVTDRDWNMSDWAPADLQVAGIVMAVEGCGSDDDQLAIIDASGQELRVLGVRRAGSRVEIVVEEPGG